MIYYQSRSLYIHIPRTSGMSLSAMVARHLADLEDDAPTLGLGSGAGLDRHAPAHKLRDLIEDFDAISKWTVVRNPWRICESMYRHFLYKHRQIANGRSTWLGTDSDFYKLLEEAVAMPFPRFVCFHFQFVRRGGFYQQWCCDWETRRSYDVRAFRYEELDQPDVWADVCRLLRVPEGMPRPRVNHHGITCRTDWDEASVRFIQERCQDDFFRLGYPTAP